MRLFLFTSITMVAFAANSILGRFALADGAIDANGFALVRLASGAVMLWLLVALRRRPRVAGRARFGRPGWGALALLTYMVWFSAALQFLNAGIGTLIQFGSVQLTMFLGAVVLRENLTHFRVLGAVTAFGGLVYLMSDGVADPIHLGGAAMMVIAAVGWGIYSLIGRGQADALRATAENFLWATPVPVLIALVWGMDATPEGVFFAALSGAITSGMGYALWYTVLPKLDASLAAVAQLTVPVIAITGGVAFLGEELLWRHVVSAAIVIVGILISLIPAKSAEP